MELISKYFNWCEGERKTGIDLGDRVSGSASQEEEKEAAVGIRANGKNERPLYQRKKKKKKEMPLELRQMGKNEVYIYGEFFDILLVVEG